MLSGLLVTAARCVSPPLYVIWPAGDGGAVRYAATVCMLSGRLVTAARCVSGTASMLSTPDGPFINLARLNLAKYASEPTLAKPLFEYIFYHENDVRHVSVRCLFCWE